MTDFGQEHIGEAIARASIDPSKWQDVTDAFSAVFPSTKTGIIGYHALLARGIPAACSGYDPSFRSSYEAHYSRIIPKLGRRLTLPVGQIVHDRELVSEEELLRSEFYNDWLRPQGDARHGAVGVLQRDAGYLITFAARVEHRATERTMPALTQSMRAACLLMRHALKINRMMLGLRLDSALLRLGVEPDGAAVLLLDPQSGILYANARAEALLADGSLIHLDLSGRLCFSDGNAAIQLAWALDPRNGSRGATFRVKSSGLVQDVRLMRLAPDTVDQIGAPMLMRSPAHGVLLVIRPALKLADVSRRIGVRLGLTRAETDVALALADGLTVAEIAHARGVSVHTVREQLKVALSKTGSRRQIDLVRTVELVRHSSQGRRFPKLPRRRLDCWWDAGRLHLATAWLLPASFDSIK